MIEKLRALLKGWKTLAFNSIMGALLIWQMVNPDTPAPADATTVTLLLDNIEGVVTVVGNILLRFRTNTPVGKSTA